MVKVFEINVYFDSKYFSALFSISMVIHPLIIFAFDSDSKKKKRLSQWFFALHRDDDEDRIQINISRVLIHWNERRQSSNQKSALKSLEFDWNAMKYMFLISNCRLHNRHRRRRIKRAHKLKKYLFLKWETHLNLMAHIS